jgi:hypothetical protein
VPVSEKTLPYELTASFLLTADAPGIPKPIKLQEQHRPMVPLDKPIGEQTGLELAAWAAGGAAPRAAEETTGDNSEGLTVADLRTRLNEEGIDTDLVKDVGKELFPGRSAGALSNAERSELLDALMAARAAV